MNAGVQLVRRILAVILIVFFLWSFAPSMNASSQVAEENIGWFVLPFEGSRTITQNRTNGGAGTHVDNEMDFAGSFEILAPKDGVVIAALDDATSIQEMFGNAMCPQTMRGANVLVLGHGGNPRTEQYQSYTYYFHLEEDSILVEEGQYVHVGQPLATSGNTGTADGPAGGYHLHFEHTTTPPEYEYDVTYGNCTNTFTETRSEWVSFPGTDSIPIGFHEYNGVWPIESGGTWVATDNSFNHSNTQNVDCSPLTNDAVIYHHEDYGGGCTAVNRGEEVFLPPDFQASSIYVNTGGGCFVEASDGNALGPNKTAFLYSTRRFSDYGAYNWNDRIAWLRTSCPGPTTLTARPIGGISQPDALPSWLLELSLAENPPLEVDIHTRVDVSSGVYDAHRMLVDDQPVFETSAAEFYYTWNTAPISDGHHKLKFQYRRQSDAGNWNLALVHEVDFYLSPNRQGTAPCGTTGNGVTLQSGSDCIFLTENKPAFAEFGWGGRSDLIVTAYGVEAWVYGGVNYDGSPEIVMPGQSRNLGGNMDSVELFAPRGAPPAVPDNPFTVDSVTTALYHFDEGSGTTVNDTTGFHSGTASASATWTSGKFGTGLDFTNVSSGRSVNMGTLDICPLTFEAWVRLDTSGGTRLAGQLGNNGNTGPNKWLISYQDKKPVLEVWSQTGSQRVEGATEVTLGEWHYLMVTYNCATKVGTIYVNNTLARQETLTLAAWPAGQTTLEIGSAESIYHFDGAIDEVRISNAERKPIHLTLDAFVSNPVNKEVSAVVTWEGAAYDWHIVTWGDNTEFGMQGNTSSRAPTHNYATAGTYTVNFAVQGADGLTYTVSDQVTVSDFACDAAVSLQGVVLYDHMICATAFPSDHVQFMDVGLYNLEDFYFDNVASSVHVPSDGSYSVRLYEGANGTGQSICRSVYDMWNMAGDYWPDNSPLDNTVSSIEIFANDTCTPPPTMSMHPSFLDPHGQIQLDVNWSGGSDAWQIVNWGDGSDYGMFGASGTQSPTHWYPGPGTYTVTFTVINAAQDWEAYTITDTVVVNGWGCGNDVDFDGVVIYKFGDCAYADESDHIVYPPVPRIQNLIEMDNSMTSLHIPAGMSVRLHEGWGFTGETRCVSWDMWNMAVDTWPSGASLDNSVTSFQVFANTTCTP